MISGLCGLGERCYQFFDFFGDRLFGNIKVISLLEIEPELGRVPKISRQSKCHLHGD